MNSNPQNILIVEDEEDIQFILKFNLEKIGHHIVTANTGEKGLKLARENAPDLILLDLMLPKLSGLEICRILKAHKSTEHIPIVMVTAKGEESDIIRGLELGAEDYITKPFKIGEVLARVKAILRRTTRFKAPNQPQLFEMGEVSLDAQKHEAKVMGKLLDLTPSEFKVLQLMLAKPQMVYTRNQILEHLWGDEKETAPRAVDVVIVGLRKKLNGASLKIETVRGIGYRLNV